MIHPAIGLRLGGSDNANFVVDIGYKLQKAEFETDWIWEQNVRKMTFNRIVLRTGILF